MCNMQGIWLHFFCAEIFILWNVTPLKLAKTRLKWKVWHAQCTQVTNLVNSSYCLWKRRRKKKGVWLLLTCTHLHVRSDHLVSGQVVDMMGGWLQFVSVECVFTSHIFGGERGGWLASSFPLQQSVLSADRETMCDWSWKEVEGWPVEMLPYQSCCRQVGNGSAWADPAWCYHDAGHYFVTHSIPVLLSLELVLGKFF